MFHRVNDDGVDVELLTVGVTNKLLRLLKSHSSLLFSTFTTATVEQ